MSNMNEHNCAFDLGHSAEIYPVRSKKEKDFLSNTVFVAII